MRGITVALGGESMTARSATRTIEYRMQIHSGHDRVFLRDRSRFH